MFQLDDNLLQQLGLGSLPPAEKNKMLAHIYETLELRVGMKLAEQMSDAQLDEFEKYIDSNDEAGALKWLETNFPNYKQVVADELEKLKIEIKNIRNPSAVPYRRRVRNKSDTRGYLPDEYPRRKSAPVIFRPEGAISS